jgi:hypothetical protein
MKDEAEGATEITEDTEKSHSETSVLSVPSVARLGFPFLHPSSLILHPSLAGH